MQATASVYLTAVIEYVMAELLEIAGGPDKLLLFLCCVSRRFQRAFGGTRPSACVRWCPPPFQFTGNTAKNHKKLRINPRHLMLSIRSDDELNKLIKATIAGGGVVPNFDEKMAKLQRTEAY